MRTFLSRWVDPHTSPSFRSAQADLKKEGLAVELALLDITDGDSIDSLIPSLKEAEEKFKPIDILINNAGFAFKVSLLS